VHRLLERQIAKARRGRADGSVDVDALLALVDATYEEADKERRLATRAADEMEREMRALHVEVRRHGEALLKGVLEAVGDGVILADDHGVIIDVNAAVEHLFGYERDALIGADLAILMAGGDADGHAGWVSDYNRTRTPHVVGRTREVMARRRDGTLIPIELAVGDLAQSGVRRFVGIVRDIGDRLRAKREIEESRQRFRDFAEASSDWMWETDAKHRFSAFAGAFERVVGFDPDKALGHARTDLMAGSAPPELIARHRADLEARRPFREFVYPMTQGDGMVRHLRINGRPVFNGDGAFIGIGTAAASVELLARAKAETGGGVEAFELMKRLGMELVLKNIPDTREPLDSTPDWYVLIEIASGTPGGAEAQMEALLEVAFEQGLITDAAIAQNDAQRAAFWRLREEHSAALKPEGGGWKHDVSVPISRIAEFIDEASAAVERFHPGARISVFGHVGDGNLHYDILPGVGQEWEGVVRRGAKLLHAFAECVVPRVTVVTRKAYGGAYVAMNSASLGATRVFAWPDAEVAVIAAVAAIRILHRRRLAEVPEDARAQVELELAAEHEVISGGIARALELGVVDEVVSPSLTRKAVATVILETPGVRGLHGNIPL